jgi:CDP-4-dehydro-6-deoxyglucose reductase
MRHTVTVRPSGHEFSVDAGETILEAGLREGLALPYGCRDGACGSCSGRLLSGEVDYRGPRPPGISDDDVAVGKALMCQAHALTDLEVEIREVGAAKGIEVKALPCRVSALERLADDVMLLKLQLPKTERLQFLAGQYIDVIMRDGRRRGFSLANAPHNDEYLELHVRHVAGGRFTSQVFTEMKEKTILRFQGPLGAFFLREDTARPLILMGGGTGFAPLKSIIEHAIYTDDQRPIRLYWGARAKVDLYLHALAESWPSTHPDLGYVPVLSEPAEQDGWQGRTGFIHEAVCNDYPDLSGFDVYMSGPPAMIEAAKRDFAARGLPEDQLFYDSFEYSIDTLDAINRN